jgi:homoserine dehydrogenase
MTGNQMQSQAAPAPKMSGVLRVAILGCGTVGSRVARILQEDAATLAARSGTRLELVGIAVRDPEMPRGLPPSLFTAEPKALVDSADVVVELMGGIEPARTLILRALRRGSSVVTANRELLALDGPALFEQARRNDAELSFEAAVAGAIPITRTIRDSLSGDRITRVLATVDATANFVLDQMDATGASFEEALAHAQRLGYVTADPTADLGGRDAAANAALLATLAFHVPVRLHDVQYEGITDVNAEDVAAAKKSGMVIKLLAAAELMSIPGGGESARVSVRPTNLPREHPLAGVRGPSNAVFIEAENAGEIMLLGGGAGGRTAASAVMGDLIAAARRRRAPL